MTPFDSGNIEAMQKRHRRFRTGRLQPDRRRPERLRRQIPPLTTERRRQIVKEPARPEGGFPHQACARRATTSSRNLKESGENEDQFRGDQKKVDGLSAEAKDEIEELARGKEKEIMELGKT